MSSLKKRSIDAVKWDVIGKFSNQGVSFGVSIILARLLPPSDFGVLGMANVFIVFTQVFVNLGFSNALVQKKETTQTQESTIFYINLIIGTGLALILFFSSNLISIFYDNDQVGDVAKIISISFVIGGFNVVQIAKLTKKLNFKILTYSQIFGAVISGIVGVGMAFTGFGIWSLVAQSLIGLIISTIYIWSFSHWRPSFEFELKSIKELWTFGKNMLLSSMLESFFQRVDILIIGKLFNASILGFYFRAKSLNEFVVRYTSQSLSRVIFPIFSEIQDDKEKVKQTLDTALNIVSFLAFGLSGLLYLIADDLIIFLFGSKWEPSVSLFKIMAFAAYVYPVNSILVNVLNGLGNSKAFLKLEIIKKAFRLVALVIGFYFGIEGYLIGLVIVGVISTMLNSLFVAKELSNSIYITLKPISIYFIIVTFSCIIVLLLDNFDLIKSNLHLINLMSKTLLFGMLYFGFNGLLQSKGWKYILSELMTIKK